MRYRLLEPLRQYATERLMMAGGLEALRRRHAAYYLMLAEQGEPAKLSSAWWPGWRERLSPEQDNFRAALRWLVSSGEARLAQRLGAALARFWLTDNHLTEGRAWLTELLTSHGGPDHSSVGVEVLIGAGQLATFQADYAAARSVLDGALALARQLGDVAVLAHAIYRRAELAWMEGEYAVARALATEGVRCSRAAGTRALEALNLFIDGAAACDLAECDVAQARLDSSLALFRAEGHPVGMGMALSHLGWVYHQRRDYTAARAHFEDALATYRQVEFHWATAFALNGLGWVATDEGELEQAGALLAESVMLAQEIGARGRLLEAISGLARLAAAHREPRLALRLASSAEAFREAPASPVLVGELEHWLLRARASLTPEQAEVEVATGRRLPLEEAVRQALQVPDHQVAIEPDIPTHADTGLTPREREVVALAAHGLNNRQIAERLVITEGTARVHVEHVLAKLGLHSRAQLAAWAVQRGHLQTLSEGLPEGRRPTQL
jgi:DNA-binding CsgD family transcriptional regulator